MRILFFGNHTVGVRTLETIWRMGLLCGVVAHPEDKEDGIRYESVYEWSRCKGLDPIRSNVSSPLLFDYIQNKKPDLIWVTDYRYLIPLDIISSAPLGAVNLHPSLLPKYRGRASINWQIINGETTLGLTAHFIDEGMDTGDIIAQRSFELTMKQDVADALNILYPLYAELTQTVITDFINGSIARTPQNHAEATIFPKRTPEDGRLSFNHNARNVLNTVRALTYPYPGAFSFVNDGLMTIWKAKIIDQIDNYYFLSKPGEIVMIKDGCIHIKCNDHIIAITDYQYNGQKKLSVHDMLEV